MIFELNFSIFESFLTICYCLFQGHVFPKLNQATGVCLQETFRIKIYFVTQPNKTIFTSSEPEFETFFFFETSSSQEKEKEKHPHLDSQT